MNHSTADIWEKFSAELRRYIARRVDNPQDVDDLLQEVFIKIHTHIDTLNTKDRLIAWIYRITRNTINDYYRTRKIHVEISDDLTTGGIHEDENPEERLASGLIEMINQLPEKYRQVMELSELKGLKQSEVARILGLTISGAKSRLQRGREQLRQALLDCCHLEFDREGRIMDYIPRQACCLRCHC